MKGSSSLRSNYSWATETLYLMTCANSRLPGTSFFSPSVLYLHYTHSSPFNFRDSRKGPISAWDIKQVGSLWKWPPLKPALHSSIFPSDSSQGAMLTTVHVWRVVCFVQSNLGQRRRKTLKVLIGYMVVIQSSKYFHSKIKMVLNVY